MSPLNLCWPDWLTMVAVRTGVSPRKGPGPVNVPLYGAAGGSTPIGKVKVSVVTGTIPERRLRRSRAV